MARTRPLEAPPTAAAGWGRGGRADYGLPDAAAEEAAALRHYAPIVKRLALHLRGRLPEAVQLDDLVQGGLIAVLRIVRSGSAAALSDAALRRTIVNAMIDEARREAWAPVRTVRLAKAVAAVMQAIKRRTGEDGSDEEVAAMMQMPLADYHRALVEIAGIRLVQLDLLEEREEDRLQVAGGQETGLHHRRVMSAMADAVAALPQREQLVVSLYYEHELNMEEVGRVLGLDKSTVCRAHGRALLLLRNALVDADAESLDSWSVAGG
jgi:RNA polymerase sigma factor FliA